MKPLEFLFKLLGHFIQFEPGRLAALQDQAAKWENETKEKDNFIAKWLKKSELWYVQVGLAIAFLISLKSISTWLMSASEPDVLDDDEEDEEKAVISKPRKYRL